MHQSSHTTGVDRPPRVKLAGTVLALVRFENGRQTTARLHQISVTGGLLHLQQPIDEGIKVEVMFHVGATTIRSKAAMLFPMWATQGCMQPFHFTELGEGNHQKLQAELQVLLDHGAASVSFP